MTPILTVCALLTGIILMLLATVFDWLGID